ncbi:peptidase S1 [Gymnodinialimonas sp. 2305UL16-5]|uniref:peptidase S1 n=1 Tax=Gymnodinialimonas mytili TaxID=3126503 RepID=UPI0030962B38
MNIFKRLMARVGVVALALAATASVAAACPNYNNPTVFGSHTLQAGFLPDPYIRNLTAGGRVNLANCAPYLGPGYVVSRPDFRLQYRPSPSGGSSPTGSLTFALQSTSSVDTVLIVNAPDGTWHYNDDTRGWPSRAVPLTNGFDSSITFFNPLIGQYDVWTGSYNPSSNNPARLIVTEYTQ